MQSNQSNPKELSQHSIQSCEEWDVGGSSFSASFMSRNQDISFGAGSPALTPCLVSGGFSFQSASDSTGLEFSSPVPSMLSFSFLSPSPVVEQKSFKSKCSTNTSDANFRRWRSSLGKLLLLPDSTLCSGKDVKETDHKPVETKLAGGTNGYNRVLGIHSKRNRTIGLGEHEHLTLW
ncbi:hypothetical protein Lalb_Chr01g0008991 [Lupinus albus]|uniref:Uncharacterized protein n=1 Tax=Lupinus albus TaxID=3870 RepID=A0A6A4R213_LUPAL|nr:hypothetical protein Lalb_Chr01g0008991 [Lupinus albus]